MEEDVMPNGYNGKILHVDLTRGELTVEEPEEAFYRKYLGGSAMGMHYILREMPMGADPVGPENVLTLMTGVTTGQRSGQSRINANAKSPISGGIGDSQGGGFFRRNSSSQVLDGLRSKENLPYQSTWRLSTERLSCAMPHLKGKRRGSGRYYSQRS
jgi:aldehyde:ferredoxin oxidoreductase